MNVSVSFEEVIGWLMIALRGILANELIAQLLSIFIVGFLVTLIIAALTNRINSGDSK